MRTYQQKLKAHGLASVRLSGEQAAKFTEIYRRRTRGLYDVHLADANLARLPHAIEQFGMDVYMQGVMDGRQLHGDLSSLLPTRSEG